MKGIDMEDRFSGLDKKESIDFTALELLWKSLHRELYNIVEEANRLNSKPIDDDLKREIVALRTQNGLLVNKIRKLEVALGKKRDYESPWWKFWERER